MADDAAQNLFAKAHEQYQSATKWSLSLLAAAVVFHATILAPYIEARTSQLAEQARLATIKQAQGEVGQLRDQLHAMRDGLKASMTGSLQQLVTDLRQDFLRLDETRQRLEREPGGRLAGVPMNPDLAEAERIQAQARATVMQTAQRPLDATSLPPRFEIADPAIVEALRREPDREALLRVIEPLVGQAIVAPRFAALNRAWREDILPPARTRIASVIQSLSGMRDRLPASEVEALSTALNGLTASLEATRFDPPPQRFWWSTVVGKEQTIFALAGGVDRLLVEPAALADLARLVDATARKSQALSEEIGKKIEALQKNLEQTGAKLADISELFGLVTLDLGTATRLAPMFLAAVVALCLVWPAQRLRDMAIAIDLMEDRQRAAGLWRWLRHRAHLSVGPAPGAVWRSLLLQSLVLGMLGTAWVTFAAAQVLTPGEAIAGSRWSAGLLPILVSLAAVAARVWTLRSVARLVPVPTSRDAA